MSLNPKKCYTKGFIRLLPGYEQRKSREMVQVQSGSQGP
jgi:hypothetical protein